jgi:hypothetical protein
MRKAVGLGTNQRNLLAHIQSVGVPSILPTDRRTLQTARGLAARGLIVLQPIDMLALDGSEVFVVSLPGETLETHIEIL